MFQNGQAVCSAPIPSNLGALSLPSHATLSCVSQSNQHIQMACSAPVRPNMIPTLTAISDSSKSSQLALHKHPSGSSCQLVKDVNAGNTRLTLSSDIPDPVKGLLEKQDGTLKFSLQCKNI
jgi:hypothetical protein